MAARSRGAGERASARGLIRLSPEADFSARCSGYGHAMSRLRPPSRDDAIVAVALAIPSVVQVLVAPIAWRPLGVVIALLVTLPIAYRRSHPALATVIGSLPWAVETDGYVLVGYVAAGLLYYGLGAWEGDTRRVLGVCALGLVTGIVGTTLNAPLVYEYVGGVAIVTLPTLAGRLARRQREQADLIGRWEAATAVAEERARIARELHDVVAHGVSVIAIQADAAEAALAKDPELAKAPLHAIRGSAAEALADMRRLLGVLREDEDGNELAPQPGLGQLHALVERVRGAGVQVSLREEGTPQPLPASLDLSAYRIVQEALTNVRKHARGAPAEVRLEWGGDALRMRIEDRGPGPNGTAPGEGHGLVGMRERVKLHGGELRTGALNGRGFVVEAALPLP
jgi:signal transduction histidine kinase